jgi:hypothetical protein
VVERACLRLMYAVSTALLVLSFFVSGGLSV